MVYFHLRGIYTLLVCGGGDFFSVWLKRKSAGAIFSSQFHVHINVEIYTCFHAFMLSPAFVWCEKNG